MNNASPNDSTSHTTSTSANAAAKLPPAFSRLALANLAAQSAEQLSLATVPLIAVLLLGAGAGEIGLLGMVQTLPFLLLSIPLGLLADRHSRKQLMIWSELLRAATLMALLAASLAGFLSLPVLLGLGFLGAIGTVGFSVAAPALVPALLPKELPRELLAAANGRLELARSTAFTAGPALAGALVAWAGASVAFIIAAMLSASAALLLLRLHEPARSPAPPRHAMLELRDGAQLVWRDAMLRPILLTSVAWNISWFVLQAAYVPYAVRTLGFSSSTVGLTLACYGAGMVVGVLLAKRVVAAMTFGHVILVGPAFSVAAALTMTATLLLPAGLPTTAAAAGSFFLFGAGPIVWTITSTTLRQTLTPGAMLSRVSAIFLTAGFGARPLGAALGGTVGFHFGEAACLLLALAGFSVQAWIIFQSKVRGLVKLPSV